MISKFEEYLLSIGYIKFLFDCKTMKYTRATSHNISTMTNLDHRFIHKTDLNALAKIDAAQSLRYPTFILGDRKGEICFGIHESGKPPTLIYPRPRICIYRTKGGKDVVDKNELLDDNMNIVLRAFSPEEIFKAMYNKSIVLNVDMRQL